MVVKPGILYFEVFCVISDQFRPDRSIIPTLIKPKYGGQTWNIVLSSVFGGFWSS
jgi:hypothetical protein